MASGALIHAFVAPCDWQPVTRRRSDEPGSESEVVAVGRAPQRASGRHSPTRTDHAATAVRVTIVVPHVFCVFAASIVSFMHEL